MNSVLLTGAGFSYNWGGRLAREFNTAVAMRVQGHPELADLLRRNPNFEEALAELQNECATSARSEARQRLDELESAIVGAFREMNHNLAAVPFEFCNDRKFSMIEFLALFDAIFTLNQDLLPEARYYHPADNLSLTGSRRWLGGTWPGTEVLPDPMRNGLFDPLLVRRRPVANPRNVSIEPQYQPYFKLHGSMNWEDASGGRLLVMGGNKPTTIARHPLLGWYADKFSEYLSRPGAGLMVIGYGFADLHINQLIYEAWERGGRTLTMFIVHPDGREILRKINPTYGKPICVLGPLEQITVYDSTRRLPTTFGGGDPGEHDLLVRYAQGK